MYMLVYVIFHILVILFALLWSENPFYAIVDSNMYGCGLSSADRA